MGSGIRSTGNTIKIQQLTIIRAKKKTQFSISEITLQLQSRCPIKFPQALKVSLCKEICVNKCKSRTFLALLFSNSTWMILMEIPWAILHLKKLTFKMRFLKGVNFNRSTTKAKQVTGV